MEEQGHEPVDIILAIRLRIPCPIFHIKIHSIERGCILTQMLQGGIELLDRVHHTSIRREEIHIDSTHACSPCGLDRVNRMWIQPAITLECSHNQELCSTILNDTFEGGG